MRYSPLPDLAFTDVETLGLVPGRHRVIEITVTRVPFDPAKWEGNTRTITQRIEPSDEDYALAESGALRVNGYHRGHPDWVGAIPSRGPENKNFWEMLNHQWFKGAALVAQNTPFDRGFIEAEMRFDWVDPDAPHAARPDIGLWDRRFIDTYSYAALIALEKGLPSWNLQGVYASLGLPELPAHRSEGDVQRCMALFKHVHDRLRRTS